MSMKHGLMKTTSRLAPIEACLWREPPRWLGALYAIRGAADEATLEDLIADPVAEAAMRADGVQPEDVIALFERLRRDPV
jgi:hypothetical protein